MSTKKNNTSERWLRNVDFKTQRFSIPIDSTRKEKLRHLLDFVRQSQPKATYGKLLENILESGLRRKTPPPAPPKNTRITADIPNDLLERVKAEIDTLEQLYGQRYPQQIYFSHVFDSYMSRNHPMLREFRRYMRDLEASQAESEPASNELQESPQAQNSKDTASQAQAPQSSENDSARDAESDAVKKPAIDRARLLASARKNRIASPEDKEASVPMDETSRFSYVAHENPPGIGPSSTSNDSSGEA